jgi:hypothetical protein
MQQGGEYGSGISPVEINSSNESRTCEPQFHLSVD